MKRGLTRTITAAAGMALHGVPMSMWRRLLPKTAIGICYHMVSDTHVPHVRHYPFPTVPAFEADLDYVQRHFGAISYQELAQRRARPQPARHNEVVVTFDDGFAECAGIVAPILRRRGMGGVFFVITDLIDNLTLFRESEASLCIEAIGHLPVENVLALAGELGLTGHLRPPPASPGTGPLCLAGLDTSTDPRLLGLLHWLLTITPAEAESMHRLAARLGVDAENYLRRAQPYLTTAQIRQLHDAGFTIGAHGCSHRWLQDLPQDEAEREIVQSCQTVRDITGQASVPFAFPYFGGGLDRAWLAGIRARHDFVGLFFDTDGLREDAPFVVQRVFGERFSRDRSLDAILRRAWARPAAWRR